MTSSRKLAVRIALATGSSVATIIGAQTIALQQGSILTTLSESFSATPESTAVIAPAVTASVSELQARVTPSLDIQRAAPSLVILRQPGSTTNTSLQAVAAAPQNQRRAIVPPQPVAVVAPPPIVVQPDPIYVQPPPVVVTVSGSSNSSNSSNSNSGGGQSQPSTPRSNSSR